MEELQCQPQSMRSGPSSKGKVKAKEPEVRVRYVVSVEHLTCLENAQHGAKSVTNVAIKITSVPRMIGTVYPNIPLSSVSIHGHPRSPLGATLGVRMSMTAYGNLSTVSSIWPISTSRLNLRPRPLSI